jgi:AraC-like DNA-binding protein
MATFSIPAAFIRAPLDGAARHGIPDHQLFAQAGIHKDDFADDGSLSPDTYARLMLTIWRTTNDEAMGLNPEPVLFRTFAMMCRSVITCATLEHAMRRASAFYRLLPHSPQVLLEQDEQRTRLLISHASEYDTDHFLSESLLVIWHRFSSWLTGRGIPLLKVECPYSAPVHSALYQDLFATPVTFDAPVLALTLPTQAIQLPLVQTANTLELFLSHSPADLLARPDPHQSVSAQIRYRLNQHDVSQLPDLSTVADMLSVSGATLRRWLRAEGTTYQKIKDDIRALEAKRLLASTEQSIADIAIATGFSETSAFTRAFTRWENASPVQFRRTSYERKKASDRA